MKDKLLQVFNSYDIALNETQVQQFEDYYKYLVEVNKNLNLTAITEEEDVIYKHFLDSVLPHKLFKQNAKVIDIGTGAGFPGIPLKILRPDLDVTLLDSLQKRVNFLNQTIQLLNLKNITAVHDRAENYVKKTRETFDVATSRAVAKVNTLSEYMLPYVKIGGIAIMYKSLKTNEEINEGQNAISTLGGKIERIEEINVKEIDATRSFVVVKKNSLTPKTYPRGKNLPKTKPI